MPDDPRDLICLITHGTDHEISSVGLTIANGGITAGQGFHFLSSSGVDLVRKRAADTTQVNPLEPLASPIKDFRRAAGRSGRARHASRAAAMVRRTSLKAVLSAARAWATNGSRLAPRRSAFGAVPARA
jgi:hypothetical protein